MGRKQDEGREDDGMYLGEMKVMRMMAIDAQKNKEKKKVGRPNQARNQLMHKVECHLFDRTFPRQRVGEQKVPQDEGEAAGQAPAAGVSDAAGGSMAAGDAGATAGAELGAA